MRKHTRRILSVMLAASLLAGQVGYKSFAEESATEEAVQTEAPAPQTEAPAPQTEPPAPQTEPPAPQTEPPAPQTEPPAPQTEAPTPQTEVPAPQTEAPAPQTEAPLTEEPSTEAPATEAQTEALPQKTETEPATEKETQPETEAKEQKFKAKTDFGKIVVRLSEKDALPAHAKLVVKEISQAEAAAALLPYVQTGHRALADVRAYSIRLKLDGEEVIPSGDVRIKVVYKKADSLGLNKDLTPQIAVFALGGSPAQLGNVELEQDENGALTQTIITGAWTGRFAIAGIQNHVNDGEEITAKRLKEELDRFPADYAAIISEYDGPGKVPANVLSLKKLKRKEEKQKEKEQEQKEGEASKEEEKPLPSSEELEKKIEKFREFSLILANGVSTDEIKIVNLYAGEDGTIDETPLSAVKDPQTGAIDVTDHLVVINIVAYKDEQELILPVYDLEDRNTEGNTPEDAQKIVTGRILYNLTAQGDQPGTVKAFKGKVTFEEEETAVGTYIAAEAVLKLTKALSGFAFADKLDAEEETKITKTLLWNDPVKEREELEKAKKKAESEKASEEASEEASEKASEEASEKASEKASEEASEKASEEASEKASEAASEKASEAASEKASEAASEKASEEASEAASEKASEEASEEAAEESAEEITEEPAETEPQVDITQITEALAGIGSGELPEEPAEEGTEETTEEITEEQTEETTEAQTEEGTEEASEALSEEAEESVTEGWDEEMEESVTEEETEPSETLAGLDEDTTEEADHASDDPEEESVWNAGVAAAEEKDHYFAGLQLEVSHADENAEKPEVLFVLDTTAEGTITLSEEQTAALAALFEEDTESVELQITQLNLPEGYVYNTAKDGSKDNIRKVTVSKNEETGAFETDPEEILFLNVQKGEYKLVLSAVEKGKEDELKGARFRILAGGEVLTDKDGKALEDLKAGAVLLNLEDYAETNDAVKEYLEALKAPETPSSEDPDPDAPQEPEKEPSLELTVEETTAPLFFEFPEETEKKITIEPSKEEEPVSDVVEEHKAVFEHETKRELKIHVSAVLAEDGSVLPGASFLVTDKDNADLSLSSQTASNVVTYTVVPADLEAFEKIDEETDVTVTVKETKVPDGGYVAVTKSVTLTASVSKGQIVWKDHSENGTDAQVRFPHNPRKVQITLKAVDTGNNNAGLEATFQLKDSSGKWIGSPLVIQSDGSAQTVTLDAKTYPGLASALAADSMTLTAVQITTDSSGNYTIVGSAEQTVTVNASDYDTSTGIAAKSVTFKNRQSKATDTIRVRKEWYVGANNRIYFPQKQDTFYVALFSDAAKTNRVTGVYTISAAAGNPYKNRTITNLAAGTYYVAETDAYGTPITTDTSANMYVTYANGGGTDESMAKIGSSTSTVHSITMKNHYKELPDGGNYLSMLGVRKVVRNENGEIDTSFSGSVKVRITYKTGSKTYKQEKTLTVNKGTSSYVVFYVPLGQIGGEKRVNIYELDGTTAVGTGGTMTLAGKKYTAEINPISVTVSENQASTPLVLITNTKLEETPETEPQDDTKPVAVLKLTKKVTYKDVPMKVNAVFYIGIFDDAQLTKLRYKKPMQLRNANELTASLKINLYKLKSQQVTFYFAEVDKNGKPVGGAKGFGFNVKTNKNSITLNKDNLEDEFIVTNDIPGGSKAEKRLTDPSSGFAGDAGAVAAAQEIQRTGNSSSSTATGDSTPILPFALAALGALALAVIALLLFRKARRGR